MNRLSSIWIGASVVPLLTGAALATEADRPVPATPCLSRAASPAGARVLGTSDPPAARRAEDYIIAAAQEVPPAEAETPEAKQARETRTKDLKELARTSKIEAFDAALFERTRAQAEKSLGAAERQLEAARQAWERLPEGERADAEKTYCLAFAAHEQAQQVRELAGEAVKSAASVAALSELQRQHMEHALAETDPARRDELAKAANQDKDEIARSKEKAFDRWLAARRAQVPAVEISVEEALSESESAAGSGRVLSNGARLSWGITGSLLRFRTERNPNLPGGDRNFRPRFEFVPAEAGFQFLSEPDGLPWRLQLKDGGSVQIVSWGGMLLAGLGEDSDVERGNLSLAATLAFFDNTIGLGAGFDLYRGIPVLGADATPGSDTAFTGVLAWALSPEGEVTAENAFLVVTINLSTLIDAVSGKHEGQ